MGGTAALKFERLTPTCVGRTPPTGPRRMKLPAHPHVRGEDYTGSWSATGEAAHPHVRGEDDLIDAALGRLPAHPHVRGEDWRTRPPPLSSGGSPPRAWGGRRRAGGGGFADRLTPTCVGRTIRDMEFQLVATAHPHVRGEDPVLPDPAPGLPGSPPRAWGGPFATC